MGDIFRIFECQSGFIQEMAFVQGIESVKQYLKISYDLTNDPDTFYFAVRIKVE